ncbi:MAG: hypothetical protein HY701_00810, partial [Gemmatimonadetes bacterium]|nr:hypothetical protein [Gemmatimonadota bacterium]
MTNTRLTKGLLTSVLTLALGAPVLVRAQAAPDLAGTWTFDADRSDQPPARGGGPGRDGGIGRGGGRDGAPGRGGGRGGGVGRGGGRDGLGGGRGRGRGLGAPATQLVITQTASE